MSIAGPKELMKQVRRQDLCTVCGGCVGLCPYHQVYQGKVAMTFDCDLPQGSCYAHCPSTGVDYDNLSRHFFDTTYSQRPLGVFRTIVAAKAGKTMGGGSFQNGGTVSALMTLALKCGLIDAAVLTDQDGLIPTPRQVTKVEEVAQCATTKYMATPTVSGLYQAIKEGREKIGVVGTACQLTSVAQMRCNPLEKEDFKDPVALTVGLFCTWALDTRKFLDFLADKVPGKEILGMDVPPPPAEIFIIRTTEGTLEIPLNEIRAMVLKGCSYCPDMTAEWSDVSVGALEGKPEWNTLIIRTERGAQLVEQAVAEGYLVLDDFPANNLNHLTLGAGNKKLRAQDKAKQEKP